MHSITLKLDGIGEVVINHNGDWSGDAVVVWNGGKERREIPTAILMAVARKSAFTKLQSQLISFLEQLEE